MRTPSAAAITDEQKRSKVMKAIYLIKSGYRGQVLCRRVGSDRQQLAKWADELGIPFPQKK